MARRDAALAVAIAEPTLETCLAFAIRMHRPKAVRTIDLRTTASASAPQGAFATAT